MYNTFLQELIQLNFLPICIILFLIGFVRYGDDYEHELTKMFVPTLVLLAVLIVDDNLDYYSLNIRSNSMFHVATAVVGYNVRIILMVSLIMIVLRNVKSKWKLFLWIPELLNFCITSLAFFTHLVFWYGENGETIRGPLSYTPHMISLFYALFLFVYGIRIARRGKQFEAVIVLLTTILAVAGTLVETLFALRGILIGVVAMDVAFYYLYIHIEFFKVDVLTGALNRISFYADTKQLVPKNHVGVLSIDLNDLKVINDTKGHAEGDKALKGVVKLIRKGLPGDSRLYRVGGDEFVVICTGMVREQMDELRNRLNEGMKNSPYTFSVGCSVWEEGESFDAVYIRADQEMYRNKKELKKQHGE